MVNMKSNLCIILFLSLTSFAAYAKFQLKTEHQGVSVFENADRSARVIKREHPNPIPVPISAKNLRGIADVRFKVFEQLPLGLYDFKVERVYNRPVQLDRQTNTYVWEGSYKDNKGRIHFVTEFLTANHTYNVFTNEKHNLKKAQQMLKEVI